MPLSETGGQVVCVLFDAHTGWNWTKNHGEYRYVPPRTSSSTVQLQRRVILVSGVILYSEPLGTPRSRSLPRNTHQILSP